MTTHSPSQIRCTVEGEAKLPPEIGGGDAVCGAIVRAALPVIERAGIAPESVGVSVQVKSDSRISAVPSIGGKALPEQNVAISDRPLNQRSITMLAEAVAAQLAK